MSRSGPQSSSGSPSITNVTDAQQTKIAEQPPFTRPDSSFASTHGTTLSPAERPREHGGREGPEPTRYGDWEKAGRCIDF
jgi:hypothetical protein